MTNQNYIPRLAIFGGFALLIAMAAQPQANPAVNRNSAIAADFDKRVGDYMKLHQKAQSGLAAAPKGSPSAAKIADDQHNLAAAIRALRSQAQQGDIFTPQIAGLFRQLVVSALAGPDGVKIRKSYTRAEPIHGIRLEVNQSYPDGLVLQSMPPSLLLNLPKLPKGLEYRFVGRELVLRDIPANLIADVIPDLVTVGGKQ